MDNFSITRYGKPLDKSRYTIDLKKKVFTSKEHNLILDFGEVSDWTFYTGDTCTFTTSFNCTFKTGHSCTFTTWSGCSFHTDGGCTFHTGGNCTFHTGTNCTFHTWGGCTFTTKGGCTFSIRDINHCKFKTYDDNSIILDRLTNEAYKLTKEFVQLRKVKNG